MRRESRDAGGSRCCAQFAEGVVGRLELQLRALVVAELAIREAHQLPNLRELVRRVQLLPGVQCGAEEFDPPAGADLRPA